MGKNFSELDMVKNHGFDFGEDQGGDAYMAAAYLARWDGPVYEPGEAAEGSEKASKHVQEVLFLPKRSSPRDNSAIKHAVMNYGAVYGEIWNDLESYFNEKKYAFWNYGNHKGYIAKYGSYWHTVSIIGWDDGFDKSNFKIQPPGNGAFICKNSLNVEFMDEGYFYVSYYDSTIGDYCVVFNGVEPADNYDFVYQYDMLGQVKNTGYNSDTACFANVFTADKAHNEALMAVSFYTTASDAEYEIFYNTDFINIDSFSRLERTGERGIIKSRGYHTVNFKMPVTLKRARKFAVAVKITTPGCSFPIPVHCPKAGYSSKARAEVGESYSSYDGVHWEDMNLDSENAENNSNLSVCLKAFTKKVEEAAPKTFSKSGENTASFKLAYADVNDFPLKFDLRQLNRVGEIKEQGPTNHCWAFASCASLESCMLGGSVKEPVIEIRQEESVEESCHHARTSYFSGEAPKIIVNGRLIEQETAQAANNGEVLIALHDISKVFNIQFNQFYLEEGCEHLNALPVAAQGEDRMFSSLGSIDAMREWKIKEYKQLAGLSKLGSDTLTDIKCEEQNGILEQMKALALKRIEFSKEQARGLYIENCLKFDLRKLDEKNGNIKKPAVVWVKNNISDYISVALQVDGQYSLVKNCPKNKKYSQKYNGFFDLNSRVKSVDGKMMIPLKFLSNALGAKYNWDSNSNTASILVRYDCELPEQSHLATP